MVHVRLTALCLGLVSVPSGAQSIDHHWIDPGGRGIFSQSSSYANLYGRLGVLHSGGDLAMSGHPFFAPLGTNGRACVSCHQPADAMSVSVAAVRERWRATQGQDPIFAPIDGANCPHYPQGSEGSHSLLLERGLFRVFLPWPPRTAQGDPIEPDFTLEVVRDPTGCNTHPEFGLRAKQPRISVYRRPRPVANLKYVLANHREQLFTIKGATPIPIDPDSGKPVSLNLLADARWSTLKLQAIDAGFVHLQMRAPLADEQQKRIVEFVMQLFVAQASDRVGGELHEAEGLGPQALMSGTPGEPGDRVRAPVFGRFVEWREQSADNTQRAFRASVARGNELFLNKPFWIRDAMHLNDRLGNPFKGTCSTCHEMRLTGMAVNSGWVDSGTTNLPWALESPELPLFKITCAPQSLPHPFLGRVIYTQDPGRALVTGRCTDVGAIVIQQLRGMAARAPYFSNGAASNFREVVDFYDRRFNIRFSEREKQDLVNFLTVL